jgi:hypothetical protein
MPPDPVEPATAAAGRDDQDGRTDAELDRLAELAVAAVAGDPVPGDDRVARRVRTVVDAIRAERAP